MVGCIVCTKDTPAQTFMKWSSVFLVLLASTFVSASSMDPTMSSDVSIFRDCEYIVGAAKCSVLLQTVKKLILASDFDEASDAYGTVMGFSDETKDLLYKTWYFKNESGQKVPFNPITEILASRKSPGFLTDFRTSMDNYQVSKVKKEKLDRFSLTPDFKNDSIEDLKQKIKLTFQTRFHYFVFTNPNTRKWSKKYLKGISFYSSTFEILEANYDNCDYAEEERIIRNSLKSLWDLAENDVGSVFHLETLMSADYASKGTGTYSNDLIFDVSNEYVNASVEAVGGSFRMYGLGKECINGLSAPFLIKIIDSVVEIVPFAEYKDDDYEITQYFWDSLHAIQATGDYDQSTVEFLDFVASLTLLYGWYDMMISDSISSIQIVCFIGIIFRFACFLYYLVQFAEAEADLYS